MRHSTRMVATAALLTIAFGPPRDPWLGADKVKHFLMSFLVHSTAFSIARSARMRLGSAQAVGVVSAATVGILREVHDRRVGKPFSIPDLVWDGVGTASSAALLNRSR